MHILKQIWQRTYARIAKPFKPRSHPAPSPLELEREITAVTCENQTLAAELQRFRTDSEQAMAEESRKIAILEAAHQEAKTARNGEAKQLAYLEQRVVELEDERNQTLGLVKSLAASLNDASTRLDTMDNQVRLLQARADEQASEFEASLSLAITRQNATDGELNALRETSQRQVKAFESSLADTSTRLETTDSQVRTLENKLDLEHRLYMHTVQEVQSQVRNQDLRLNWTMMAAVFAMLLGTVAGVILIWDVQKNAGILAGMSKDVKQLMSSMEQPLTAPHPAGTGEPAVLPDPIHAERHGNPKGRRDVGGESLSRP